MIICKTPLRISFVGGIRGLKGIKGPAQEDAEIVRPEGNAPCSTIDCHDSSKGSGQEVSAECEGFAAEGLGRSFEVHEVRQESSGSA